MNDFPADHDQAVDILAWLVTLTDPLMETAEVAQRIQRARHLVNQGNPRAVLMLTGLLVGLVDSLPADDRWLAPGQNRYGFTDVDLRIGAEPPLIHTLRITGSIDLDSETKRLIDLARFGWPTAHQCTQAIPDTQRFDVISNALRHVMRRTRMYVGVDPRLWQFLAYLGAAPACDETKLQSHSRPLKIPTGLYSAICVETAIEPPF